jgi:hypothetical protein
MENKKSIWAELLQKWGYTKVSKAKVDSSVEVAHEEVEDKELKTDMEDVQVNVTTDTLPGPPQVIELPKDYIVDEYTEEELKHDNVKDESEAVAKTIKKETTKKATKTKKINKKK